MFNERISLLDKRFTESFKNTIPQIVLSYVLTFGLEECAKVLMKHKLIHNVSELQDFVKSNKVQLEIDFKTEVLKSGNVAKKANE